MREGKRVPSMIRNQNEGMKNKTHEIIKCRTVGEAPMAAEETSKKQRDRKQREKEKQSIKKQRKMRFEPVMAKDENGPKHGTLSDPIDGPEEPGIEEDGGGDQCRDDG